MDPKACFQRIVDAAKDQDRAEFDSACEDLADWCERGGFVVGIEDAREIIGRAGLAQGHALRVRGETAADSQWVLWYPAHYADAPYFEVTRGGHSNAVPAFSRRVKVSESIGPRDR